MADPDLHETLRRARHLTGNPLAKECKKPRLKRACKAPQYTKH